jgi:hypothetical protein
MDCFNISEEINKEDLIQKNNCVIICKSSEFELLNCLNLSNSLIFDLNNFLNQTTYSKCFREFVMDLLEEEIYSYHKKLIKLHSKKMFT